MGGHAYMRQEDHEDDCAKDKASVHTLYIRLGSPQKLVNVGVICSCCYNIILDHKWKLSNEDQYEVIKRRIPRTHSGKNFVQHRDYSDWSEDREDLIKEVNETIKNQ